jgi:hypothetical protein
MTKKTVWAKKPAIVPKTRKARLRKPLTIEDWFPGDILIWESQYPDQIMNARRQALITLSTKETHVYPDPVEPEVRAICRSFFGDCQTIALWQDSQEWGEKNAPR